MILVEQGDWPESRGLAVRRSGRLEADEKKKFKFSFVCYLAHLNGVFIDWPTWRLSIDASFDIFQPIKNGDRVVSPERLLSGFRPIRTGIVAKCLDLAHRT